MKYIKTVHKDRVVEYPNRYKDQNNNIITLTQEPGHIVEEGTLIDAEKLNKIEDELERLSESGNLICYSKTLIVSNWVLNETTNIYEYNATNENITEKHIITIDADIINRQKFTGIGSVKSYNGGFKIEATELPETDIEITVSYQLSTLEVREPINEEVTEEVVENAG